MVGKAMFGVGQENGNAGQGKVGFGVLMLDREFEMQSQ